MTPSYVESELNTQAMPGQNGLTYGVRDEREAQNRAIRRVEARRAANNHRSQ
jgi:hypothetical protein